MKPARARGPGGNLGSIPRRNRRGLIEAPGRAAAVFFRGRIPRRNRRGLIEAPTAASTRAPSGPEFPGEIAGASLKRADGHRALAVAEQFPGEIAGASLKLVL